jgi:hypothetical protein
MSSKVAAILGRPITGLQAILGWMLATAVFFITTDFLGGPVESDSAQSIYSTWSIEHGNLACAFPPHAAHFNFQTIADPYAFIAPIWPIVSGFLAFVFRIGYTVPFPALRPNCSNAEVAIYHWFAASDSALPTVRLGYFAWLFLLAGVVAYLRSTNRGRTLWEPFALIVLAVVPAVNKPILQFFHPQDILAVGLVLMGAAFVRRDRWLLAGIFFALAFSSQQFAILAIIPILVITPRNRLVKFIGGLALASIVVDLPFVLLAPGRALRAIIIGSSRNSVVSSGGTWLWELLHWHYHAANSGSGVIVFLMSRSMPIIVAAFIAWEVKKRIGNKVFDPVPLTCLLAISLIMRLVFEINLFGYYFMATAVMLVMVDVVRGQIRGGTLAWLFLSIGAFNPIPFGFVSNDTQPINEQLFRYTPWLLIGLAALIVVVELIRRRLHWYWVATLLALVFLCEPKVYGLSFAKVFVPNWLWQVILVPAAMTLVVVPLIEFVKSHSSKSLEDELGSETLAVPLGIMGDASSGLTEGSPRRPE